jgi:hypothetical protein
LGALETNQSRATSPSNPVVESETLLATIMITASRLTRDGGTRKPTLVPIDCGNGDRSAPWRSRRIPKEMVNAIEIRDTRADDLSGIEALYPITFPDEDLLPLVRELMDGRSLVLSLAGLVGETVVAMAFSRPVALPERHAPSRSSAPSPPLPTGKAGHRRQNHSTWLTKAERRWR